MTRRFVFWIMANCEAYTLRRNVGRACCGSEPSLRTIGTVLVPKFRLQDLGLFAGTHDLHDDQEHKENPQRRLLKDQEKACHGHRTEEINGIADLGVQAVRYQVL